MRKFFVLAIGMTFFYNSTFTMKRHELPIVSPRREKTSCPLKNSDSSTSSISFRSSDNSIDDNWRSGDYSIDGYLSSSGDCYSTSLEIKPPVFDENDSKQVLLIKEAIDARNGLKFQKLVGKQKFTSKEYKKLSNYITCLINDPDQKDPVKKVFYKFSALLKTMDDMYNITTKEQSKTETALLEQLKKACDFEVPEQFLPIKPEEKNNLKN